MTIPGIFTQRDARWSNDELGYNNDPAYNLYHYGCLVTGIANLIWYATGDANWTPRQVNQWLKDHNGFTPGGGLVIWGVVGDLLRSLGIEPQGYSSDENGVNNFLRDENAFAITWITKAGFPQHWSVMPFMDRIADSWDGVLKDVDTYTFHGAYLYRKVTPQPAPIPAPAPEPAPTPPPIVAPAPEPVPTSTVPQPDPTPIIPTNGQPSGDIPVTVVPEYITSFVPDPQEVWLKQDATAVDLTGEHSPRLVRDTDEPVPTSGHFTFKGMTYYKGTKEGPGYYGLPAEYVDAPNPIKLPNYSLLERLVRFLAGWRLFKKGSK